MGASDRARGPRDEHVADLDFAEHFVAEVGELAARGEAGEVGLIFGFDFVDVEAVEMGIVEEVALDAPGFAVHLASLGAGIDDGEHAADC